MSVIEAPVRTETTVTEADVLERAAWYLEEFGWCQGYYARDAEGLGVEAESSRARSFCAMGAAFRASLDLTSDRDSDDLFPMSIFTIAPDGCVGYWNDLPGRTREEVVSAIRDAAERARTES